MYQKTAHLNLDKKDVVDIINTCLILFYCCDHFNRFAYELKEQVKDQQFISLRDINNFTERKKIDTDETTNM